MKKKKVGGGRPKKENQFDEYEILDDGYLAINDRALKLYELISEMANYKVTTITGPPGKRQSKTTEKSRKEVEKQQDQIRKQNNLENDHVFFLKNPKDKQYQLIDGLIRQCNNNNIHFDLFITNQELIRDLELLFQELNENTQTFIQEFIIGFQESTKVDTTYLEQMIKIIEQNQIKYQELLLWDSLYECAFNEKINLLKRDLQIFEEDMIQPKGKTNMKKQNVEKRKKKQIKQEQKQIEQLEKIQKPHRPLKYFLNRFFLICMKKNIDGVEDQYDQDSENL